MPNKVITPAVLIIFLICFINAGSMIALWTTSNKTANAAHRSAIAAEVSAETAQKSANAALKLAKNNERVINLMFDQICVAETPNTDQPNFCKYPGVK